MNAQIILIIIGAGLVVIAIVGGGIEIKEIKVPTINKVGRILASICGLIFISLGILISLDYFKKDEIKVDPEPNILSADTLPDLKDSEKGPTDYYVYIKKSYHGTYLSVDKENVDAKRVIPGLRQKWTLRDLNGGELQKNDPVNFISSENKYLTVKGNDKVLANKQDATEQEIWTIAGINHVLINERDTINIKWQGRFLIANSKGKIETNEVQASSGAEWIIEFTK